MSDLHAAQKYREETIEWIRKCLTSKEHALDVDRPSSTIIEFFQVSGPAIAKSSTTAQKQQLLDELLLFINMANVEQEIQLGNTLPTLEEYEERRMGSSAVRVCLAMTEPVSNDVWIYHY